MIAKPQRRIENTDPTKLQGIPGGIRILVPKEVMKNVIGPGGTNVQRIGRETGTIVNVSANPFVTADQCTDHIVSIYLRVVMPAYRSPMHQCVAAMKYAVKLAFNLENSGDNPNAKVILLVDASLAGLIIGKQGARKRNLEVDNQVAITLTIPPEGQADEECSFSGPLENIGNAIESMDDIFKIQMQPKTPVTPSAMSPMGNGAIPANYGNPGQVGELNVPRVDPSSKSRDYILKVPPTVDPGAFIGKSGKFMNEIKKNAREAGGFVFKLHLGDDPLNAGEKQLEVTSTDTVAWYVVEMCMRRFHVLEETQPINPSSRSNDQ